MTRFAQWRRTMASPGDAAGGRRPRKYDLRIVDHFYGYCDAVARTHRHRDEARLQSQLATRRSLASMILGGGLLFYYILERISQVIL